MKKIYILFLLLVSHHFLHPQGMDNLAIKVSSSLENYFTDKYNVKAAIVKYENYSGLSDVAAQKFYQLLVSKLELSKSIDFYDLMINFNKNVGRFNRSNMGNINHYIYVKLIRMGRNVGAGTVVFSKNLDKIVLVKYFETAVDKGERDLLGTSFYGFEGAGFSKITDIRVSRDLLDVGTLRIPEKENRYLMFYPDKVEIYRPAAGNLSKITSIQLDWGRPYYPAITPLGEMLTFSLNGVNYVTLGCNFSPISKVFEYSDTQWKFLGNFRFVPLNLFELNKTIYIAGANYEYGTNYFTGKILLSPFSGNPDNTNVYTKDTVPFFAMDFSKSDNQFSAVHLIDRNYIYHSLASDFEEQLQGREKRGSALCSSAGEWLAMSDYSTVRDKLYFYKIENQGNRLVYENPIDGEIQFISPGSWNAYDGFWILVKKKGPYSLDYILQFWSKKE